MQNEGIGFLSDATMQAYQNGTDSNIMWTTSYTNIIYDQIRDKIKAKPKKKKGEIPLDAYKYKHDT